MLITGSTISSKAANRPHALPRSSRWRQYNTRPDAKLPLQSTRRPALRSPRPLLLPQLAAIQYRIQTRRRFSRTCETHERSRPHTCYHPNGFSRLPANAPGRVAKTPGSAYRGRARSTGRSYVTAILLRIGASHTDLLLDSWLDLVNNVHTSR